MKLRILLVLCLTLLISSGNVLAATFSQLDAGTNITINDTIWNSTYHNPGAAQGIGLEDNETERTASGNNTYTGQRWDLEGIFINRANNTLTLIGGTNFAGITFMGNNYATGDLFLGHFGSPPFSPSGALPFIPAYALDFDRDLSGNLNSTGGNGTIYGPGVNSSLTSDVTPLADPFEYLSGGISQGTFTYATGLIEGAPFQGWTWLNSNGTYNDSLTDNTHYFLQLSGLNELDQLITNQNDIFHITLSCGNDTMRGQTNPVPEPSTMLLFGSGLVGLAGWRWRRK